MDHSFGKRANETRCDYVTPTALYASLTPEKEVNFASLLHKILLIAAQKNLQNVPGSTHPVVKYSHSADVAIFNMMMQKMDVS